MKASPAHFTYAAAAYLTTLVLTSPAAAATAEDRTPLNLDGVKQPAEKAASEGGGGGIARMVVGLAVVLAVIYGLSWVAKQVKASKEGSATGGSLTAISSLPLGPNRAVHLIRAGNDLVLLGAAEKGVTPIRTYTEAEARAAGLLGDDDTPLLPAVGTTGGAARPAGGLVESLRQRTVRR
jgi:flagellar protein FliO/FliZ